MIRNNQNGRRRGRGGARPAQGGGPSGNYGNSNGGGSRIDTRQRGNAMQLLEKYKAMARDATQNGDRVQAEFYMQYADHYFRVLNEFRARDPQPAPRPTYDDDDDGYGAPGVGQNYAAASERYDDDGDEAAERPRDGYAAQNNREPRGEGYAGQNNREPRGEGYAAQGNREPRGEGYAAQGNREPRSEGYAAQGNREPRDSRDAGRQGYARNGSDDGREARDGRDAPRDSRGEAPRDTRDAPRRDDGRSETPQRADAQSARGETDGDAARRDNGTGSRRNGADTGRRERTPRYDAGRDSESAPLTEREPLAGLPGPATLTATFAAPRAAPPEAALPEAAASEATMSDAPAVPAAPDAEVPVRRPRGRPRKVVVTDSVDG